MSSRRSFSSGLFSLIFIVLVIAGLIFHRQIIDQYKFLTYQPSSEIANLAERSGFSDSGKFYFYITSPQLETAEQFNEDCRRIEQASPILGCYNQGADTIHIFDINSQELDGIKEVTAAHEMLHAVFSRLSKSEIDRLATLLEAAYESHKTPKLEERMAYYQRSQPGSKINELHSILGTEVEDLGAELEKHYAKYFANRQKVVGLFKAYNQKFDDIEREAEQLSSDLKQRIKVINSERAAYETDLASLNLAISDFNSRASSGEFTSQNEFQRIRNQLMNQMSHLRLRQSQIDQQIKSYNQDVERLNNLGVKMQQLNQSLDSMKEVNF